MHVNQAALLHLSTCCVFDFTVECICGCTGGYAPPLHLLVLGQRPTVLHFEALAVWGRSSSICRTLRWRCGVNVALVVRAVLAAIAGLPSRADSGGSAVNLLGSWQERRASLWPAWVPKAVNTANRPRQRGQITQGTRCFMAGTGFPITPPTCSTSRD